MTGQTGYTTISNGTTYDPPTHHNAILAHFDPLVGESDVNAAALPASGNWYNRTIMTQDTKAVYVWNGSAWVMQSLPWTTFTPSATNITVGTGGSVLYAKKRITNGVEEVRIGWQLGSSGFTVGDINITPPDAIASWCSTYPIQAGHSSFIDSSAGSSGRYWAPIYAASGNLRLVSISGTAGLMAAGLSTAPFTWAASDEIHVAAAYPIA